MSRFLEYFLEYSCLKNRVSSKVEQDYGVRYVRSSEVVKLRKVSKLGLNPNNEP